MVAMSTTSDKGDYLVENQAQVDHLGVWCKVFHLADMVAIIRHQQGGQAHTEGCLKEKWLFLQPEGCGKGNGKQIECCEVSRLYRTHKIKTIVTFNQAIMVDAVIHGTLCVISKGFKVYLSYILEQG